MIERHAGRRHQLVDRQQVPARQHLGGREDFRALARLLIAEREARHVAKLLPRPFGIGLGPERDGPGVALSVGLDQCRIDAVERRTRHQSDRQHRIATHPHPPCARHRPP